MIIDMLRPLVAYARTRRAKWLRLKQAVLARSQRKRNELLAERQRQEQESLAIRRRPLKLHLGCGHIALAGFCNVDALTTGAQDVVDDIRTLARFPESCAQEIYACHVLEHFAHDEIVPILTRWFQVLEPGGHLRISVPDIDRIVRIYDKNFAHFQKPGHTPWIGLLYGGQTTPYDFHKTGFNACWLRYLLEQVGFVDCAEYPHEPHFVPGTVDASLAFEPFGEFLSLNMIARRPDAARA